MSQPDPNIELGSQASVPQPAQIQNPPSNLPQYNYQPQEDEESRHEDEEIHPEPHVPPQRPQFSLWSKIQGEKVANITIISTLFLYITILGTCAIAGLYLIQQVHKLAEMRDLMKGPFRFMSENLNADPIMKIKIVDLGSVCPFGFVPLRLGNWSGTVTGCLCETGDLLDTECENANPRKCKKEIPSMDPIEMNKWDDKIWCVKRATLGGDYLRKAECPSGYKECYPGGCFIGDCPVTKVEMASFGTDNKFNNKQKYLVATNTQGELPLTLSLRHSGKNS